MLKSKMANLYIYPEHYNEAYNFYNYHKFKTNQTINIQYKSPSIFLNGLYFELPFTQILSISKAENTTEFEITIQLLDSFKTVTTSTQVIQQCFAKIEQFNREFFTKYESKLEVKNRRTLKSSDSSSTITQSSTIPTTASLRFNKNPISRKYEYQPFYTVHNTGTNNDNNSIQSSSIHTPTQSEPVILKLRIKHIYLLKLMEQILPAENGNREQQTMCNTIIDFINQEYFDFRRAIRVFECKDVIKTPVQFWIKCNTFENTPGGYLQMIWKICDFNI